MRPGYTSRGDDHELMFLIFPQAAQLYFYENIAGELCCYFRDHLMPRRTFTRYRVEGPLQATLWYLTVRLYDGITTFAPRPASM